MASIIIPQHNYSLISKGIAALVGGGGGAHQVHQEKMEIQIL